MLKKFLSLLCVGLMSFAFVGCDAGAVDSAADDAGAAVEEAAEGAEDAMEEGAAAVEEAAH